MSDLPDPTFVDAKIAIYDSVLSADRFEEVWSHVQRDQYKVPTRNDNWIKVWRLGDGHSVSSKDYRLLNRPLGNPLDFVLEALLEIAQRHPDLVGTLGIDWSDITLRSYLYPRGSKLSWHDDTSGYSGAFSFYAHPKWGSTWGGELMVAETSSVEHIKASAQTGPYLDRGWEDKYVLAEGRGMFFSAKPNRLAIFSPGTYHAINRVDADAGDHARCSVSGFFVHSDSAA